MRSMSDELKRERARKATAKYHAAHRDELNAKYRERLATDPEFRERRHVQIAASVTKWKRANPEHARERGRRCYAKHRGRYREIARAYYHAHKEERQLYARRRYRARRSEELAYMRARGQALKAETLAAYGGARCVCCGETVAAFLTIDHIDGCGVARRKTEGAGTTFYRLLKKRGFPPGFRVLCFNCNCGRRVNRGRCPHEDERAATA